MFYRFQKPARPVRTVFVHCSASDRPEHDSAAVIDRWHRANGWAGIGYHYFIRKDGTLETGRDLEKVPAAQEGHNTGSIAICLHGLEYGKFTPAQFATLRGLSAQINRAYGGQIRFRGHCEVSPKSCPVFAYEDVLGIDAEGKMPLSRDVSIPQVPVPNLSPDGLEVLLSAAPVMKVGSRGEDVRALQTLLSQLGYHTGAIDGIFGNRTRDSVIAFQADNHLSTDGLVGALTREALGVASPRPIAPMRAFAGISDLAAGGSRIAKASINSGIVGALLGGSGLVTIVDQVNGQADIIGRLFNEHGIVAGAVILAAGTFVAWQAWRAGQARVEDHRSGKTS